MPMNHTRNTLPPSASVKTISLNKKQKKNLTQVYQETTSKELLSVLWDEQIVKPEDQMQAEDHIHFGTQTIAKAQQELNESWDEATNMTVVHNHNRDSNHGFGFSKADLQTAKTLHAQHGIDQMWLIMNGKTVNGEVAVQHMIIGNAEWELHDIEGETGKGKVVTMFKDSSGVEHELYSDSIKEAEEKERIITALKEQLLEDDVAMAA